jgi:4-hydroxybenzoate polyprenyltransferase
MLYIEILVRLTRINEYLKVLILIFPLIFLISPQNLFSYITIVIFLANLFLTAFLYSFNDIEDAEDDYHDIEKKERNLIANKELTKKQGYLFSFFLLFIGLFLLYIINSIVLFFGLIFAFVGFLYSWKPVRLKSIPIIDLISHVICLGTLQFLIIYLAFRTLDLFIIPFLMIIIPFSLMNQILGELTDFKVDNKTKITNTIQKFERFDLKKILITLSVIVITGFSILIFTMPPENRIISLSITFLIGIMALFRLHAHISKL